MYILSDVPKDVLEKLDEIIYKKNKPAYNQKLAGQIKNEFGIREGISIVSPFLMQMINAHNDKHPAFIKKAHSLFNYKTIDIELFDLWVNFQKKYEFNPPHIHDGLFSFVIWYKVPYLLKDEKANFPNMDEKDVKAGQFAFLFTAPDGRLHTEDLPVDKEWEGKIALFPADLNHMVYPFYTSDEYRISISGNLGFKTSDK